MWTDYKYTIFIRIAGKIRYAPIGFTSLASANAFVKQAGRANGYETTFAMGSDRFMWAFEKASMFATFGVAKVSEVEERWANWNSLAHSPVWQHLLATLIPIE